MTLAGMEGEPAVLEGRGRIEIPTPEKMMVHLEGRREDLRHSLRAINRLRDNPYEERFRFRVHMTDTLGCTWSAGCEVEQIEPGDEKWSFLGWTQGLLSSAPTEPHPTGLAEPCFLVPPIFQHPECSESDSLLAFLQQSETIPCPSCTPSKISWLKRDV